MGGSRRRTSNRQSKCKTLPEERATADVGETAPPQQPQRHNARHAQGLKPDQTEVLAAVESLYIDQLKPFGRILRKRIAERAVAEANDAKASGLEGMDAAAALGSAARGALPYLGEERKEDSLPDVDIKHLRGVCDASGFLKTEEEDGGDWSALLTSRSEPFVDVYSPQDPYPEAMWQVAREYFEALLAPEMELPGGRYSCAQALVARNLPFLENRSLGEVCHVVQLAISKKKILGYCNGSVVPYSRSQSKVKEECAASEKPCAPGTEVSASSQAMQLATLEVARLHLWKILEEIATTSGGPAQLPLSNVKRLFRSRYHIELSETTLGHSKLSDLLQDEKFSDVCKVKLEGHGYIVVQASCPPTMNGSSSAFDDSLPQRVPIFCPGAPLDLEAADEVHALPIGSPSKVQHNYPFTPHDKPPVTRTFITYEQPPPTPLPGARRRAASLPSEHQMLEAMGVPPPLNEGSGDAGDSIPGSTQSGGGASLSPAPSWHQEMPMHLPLPVQELSPETEASSRADERRPRFQNVEPLPFEVEDFGICVGMPLPTPPPGLADPPTGTPPGLPDPPQGAAGRYVAYSPSKVLAKNTFIHMTVTPMITPAPTAARRTRSLPQKGDLEAAYNPLALLKRPLGLQGTPKEPWSPEPAKVPLSPALTSSPKTCYS